MIKFGIILAVFAGLVYSTNAQEKNAAATAKGKPLYENNFEQAALNSVPQEMLVLEGGFAVKEEGGNKFLELPGAPLDTFAVLFGPTEKEDVAVSARIFGTGKGRRFPAFAVGLNGGGGFKLQVSPGKKALEIYRGDAVKASVPFAWESGKWTELRLQVRKAKEGEWLVSGKVWTSGATEAAGPTISLVEKEAPPAGRASVWGNPFAGTPIRFDALVVSAATGQP